MKINETHFSIQEQKKYCFQFLNFTNFFNFFLVKVCTKIFYFIDRFAMLIILKNSISKIIIEKKLKKKMLTARQFVKIEEILN